MLNKGEIKQEKKPWIILGVRVSAVLETIVFLGVLLFFNYIYGSGDRYIDVKPHPFWVIILIISVQYGTAEGVIAVVLSTIALYAGNVPPSKFSESLFEYRATLAITPTLWFIAAIVLGEMRMSIARGREKFKALATEAENKAEQIATNYESLREKKEHIEIRLASQMRSIAFTYRALRHLESMNPGRILLSITDMVQEVIRPNKFSIYSFSSEGFEAMVSEGWSKIDKYQRRFPTNHPLSQAILTRKGVVCIINEEDEKTLEGEGVLAAPIFDSESGEIFGMLKIENIDFSELNISNIELAQTLCELVGSAFSNAQKYRQLERYTIYSKEEVFSYFLYKIDKARFYQILSALNQPLSEIDIKIEPPSGRPDEDFLSRRTSLIRILKQEFLDLKFLYQMGLGELHYAILMPLTSERQALKKKAELENALTKDLFLSQQKQVINVSVVKGEAGG